MQFEATLGGRILKWSNDRRTKMRVEIALKRNFNDLIKEIDTSSAIQEQILFSGFSTLDGKEIPEEEILELIEKDPQGFQEICTKIANNGESPLQEAPLSESSENGASLD